MGSIINPHNFADYPVDAVVLDGVDDYMSRAALVGEADSKLFTYVHWLRKMGANGASERIFEVNNQSFRLTKTAANALNFECANAAAATILNITSTGFTVASGWKCVMVSANLAASPALLYFGDTSSLASTTTFTNDTIDLTSTGLHIGHEAPVSGGGDFFDGYMGPMFLWYGVKADFTSEAVRRYFIDALGRPADSVGAAAIAALGTPISHHYLLDGEDPANYAINRGSGGNYTISGAFTTAPNSPSD